MRTIANQQPLSRRLLGQYLMFGLLNIVVLAASLFALDRRLHHHGGQSEQIARIKEVRSLIVADFAERQGATVQSLLHSLETEDWVSFVAVVSDDGKFIAHSKPIRIGEHADFHIQMANCESLVQRRIMMDDGSESSELLAAFPMSESQSGYLQIGLISDANNDWLHKVSQWFSFSIVAPMMVLIAGAGSLLSSTRTHSAIEDQLCAVSSSRTPSDFRLRPLEKKEPTALGWNRLIEHALGKRSSPTLDASLARSLENVQQKRFEGFLNALPDGIAVTDLDGRIIYANHAFAVLLQTKNEGSQRGRQIAECFPVKSSIPSDAGNQSRPMVFEALLGETVAEGILRIGRYPQQAEENAPPRQYVWTIRDITQQKLADEMRTQFVYSATHELRTPLANIKAYAETLTMNDIPDPEQQKGFLNIINSEATRLGRFVEELLNISQMEAGSLSLTQQDVDVERMLKEVTEKVMPQMQRKQIAFDLNLPAKMPRLKIDKDKVIAALVNLLGNAAKYTPDNGRVVFKVTVGPKEFQMCVEDTGFGISKEDLPKLFTKFFRSEDARVREVAGSGLGLSFTHEVVRHHGGRLVVHSELNKGSQFTMILPII